MSKIKFTGRIIAGNDNDIPLSPFAKNDWNTDIPVISGVTNVSFSTTEWDTDITSASKFGCGFKLGKNEW